MSITESDTDEHGSITSTVENVTSSTFEDFIFALPAAARDIPIGDGFDGDVTLPTSNVEKSPTSDVDGHDLCFGDGVGSDFDDFLGSDVSDECETEYDTDNSTHIRRNVAAAYIE